MTGHAPAVASWDFLTLFTLTIKPEKQTHLFIFRFFLNLVFNYCVMSDIQNSQPSDLEDVPVDLIPGHAPNVFLGFPDTVYTLTCSAANLSS